MERNNYYDVEGCAYGDEEPDGTCLPLKAHQLLLNFYDGGPTTRIVCPEDGCIQLKNTASPAHGQCWVMDWHDNLGDELVGEGTIEVLFGLDGESDCDMLVVWPTGIAEVRNL